MHIHDLPKNIPLEIKFISNQPTPKHIVPPENWMTNALDLSKFLRRLVDLPTNSNSPTPGKLSTLSLTNHILHPTDLHNFPNNTNLHHLHLSRLKENQSMKLKKSVTPDVIEVDYNTWCTGKDIQEKKILGNQQKMSKIPRTSSINSIIRIPNDLHLPIISKTRRQRMS